MIFEHEGNAAIIEGDWKLVGKNVIQGDEMKREGSWSLHDLASDPCELSDLSGKHPELVARMLKTFEVEARRTLVMPAP